jgi:DNA-binding LytR/AlgR family response regulator
MTERPLRCLVVEDEWPARNYLVELLHGTRLAEVVGAVASVEEAKEALGAKLGLEVAFVDVQLSRNTSGLELVRMLAEQSSETKVVLATAHEQHALEAFSLGVVDYLLKPFSEERVLQCLTRLKQRARSNSMPVAGAAKIVARRKRNLVFLSPDEVWAFEAADRLTFVHTRHGRFDVDLSLSAIELSLGAGLARVHRNWLVNVAHVKELERDTADTTLFVGDALSGDGAGVRVPVSRERAQEVRDMLLAMATGVRKS